MFTDSNNTNTIPGSAVEQIKLGIQLLDISVTRLARHPSPPSPSITPFKPP